MRSRVKSWVVMMASVAAVLAMLGLWVRREFQIDKCLDHGGAWNYDMQQCEGARGPSH
jgi:hypothetical protein